MKLDVVALSESRSWDRAVDAASRSAPFLSHQYVKAEWEANKVADTEALLLSVEALGASAVLPVFRRPLPKGMQRSRVLEFDASTPYGPAGPAASTEPGDPRNVHLGNALMTGLQELNVASLFGRWDPFLTHAGLLPAGSSVLAKGKAAVVDLNYGSQPYLSILKKSVRSEIRRLLNRADVRVEISDLKVDPETFANGYRDAMLAKNAAAHYMYEGTYFEDIASSPSCQNMVALAYTGGGHRPVAAALFVARGRHAHYHLGWSDPSRPSEGLPRLLIYEAVSHLSGLGYDALSLGGGLGLSVDDGLYRFKKSLATSERDSAVFGVVLSDTLSGECCPMQPPFPLYRFTGSRT